MTSFKTILNRGYFPKELPPSFVTESFADYAMTKAGRKSLVDYKPIDGITDCVHYDLAMPGLSRRPIRIPHPASWPCAWISTSIRELLYRDLYRGIIVWNKTCKRNTWGLEKRSVKAAADWITIDAPHNLAHDAQRDQLSRGSRHH